jgi:hypothetical protein
MLEEGVPLILICGTIFGNRAHLEIRSVQKPNLTPVSSGFSVRSLYGAYRRAQQGFRGSRSYRGPVAQMPEYEPPPIVRMKSVVQNLNKFASGISQQDTYR